LGSSEAVRGLAREGLALDDPAFHPRRVLLRGPNPLGDAVLAEPAARAIRARFPAARLELLLAAPVAPLGAAWPFVDTVTALPLGGTPAPRLGRLRLVLGWRARRPDLCVLFPNALNDARLGRLGGARRILGYARNGRERFLSDALPHRPAQEREPMPDYYGRLAAALGATPAGPPRLVPPAAMLRQADTLLAGHGLAGKRVLAIAPGAGFGPAKHWPAAHFGALARHAARELGLASVLLGTEAERPLASAVAAAAGAGTVDLSGCTDLGALIGVLARAAAFAGNDSGSAHVAAALGRPGIVLFGSTDPARSAVGPALRPVRQPPPCAPCFVAACPLGHHACLAGLPPEAAFSALAEALGGAGR
jgi:heptosyltransferase-2